MAEPFEEYNAFLVAHVECEARGSACRSALELCELRGVARRPDTSCHHSEPTSSTNAVGRNHR
jgi:hypothetical protein